MAYTFANDWTEITMALQSFVIDHASDLPAATRDQVVQFSGHPSPVDRIVKTAEALYTIKSDLTAAGREITAKLAQFAAVNGYHDMAVRGMAISNAMQRISHNAAPAGMSWPAASEDPAPLAQMLPPETSE